MSDLIDRKAAIDAIHGDLDWLTSCGAKGLELSECMERAISILNALPSAEPERATGHWVKADSAQYFRKHYPSYTCSLCNFKKNGRWNYCPNCGARMDE